MQKANLAPVTIISGGDMSSSITSKVTNILNQDNVSIELSWTGTPNGSFAIQGSLTHAEQNGNVTNVGTWTPITLPAAVVAVGSAGSALLDLNQLSFPWIRVVYTASSGSGSLTYSISGKQV